jgi:hypothetical protein
MLKQVQHDGDVDFAQAALDYTAYTFGTTSQSDKKGARSSIQPPFTVS